jgi:hypothetical protein
MIVIPHIVDFAKKLHSNAREASELLFPIDVQKVH